VEFCGASALAPNPNLEVGDEYTVIQEELGGRDCNEHRLATLGTHCQAALRATFGPNRPCPGQPARSSPVMK
jgi:hypothetical protein